MLFSEFQGKLLRPQVVKSAPYLASTSFMRFLKMLRSLVWVSLYSYQACSSIWCHVTPARQHVTQHSVVLPSDMHVNACIMLML